MTQYDVVGQEYLSARKEKESIKEKKSKDFILKEVDFHNKLVLDIGCGAGEDFAHFENNGAKEVYGIDNSEFMINKVKRIVKNPENVVFADVYQLPFPDAKFDIIIAKHSLHYLTNFDGALKEIVRVLKKEGRFVFTVPHPFSEIFIKDSKSYDNKENVRFKAHNKFILEFPAHTLSDYLTEQFLALFEISKVWEFTKQEEWIKEIEAPVVLGIIARKK